MAMSSVVLAFASAFFFGLALFLTQLGLRHVPPLSGAAVSIPSSTLTLLCIAPAALAGSTPDWRALPIFLAVGLLFPGAVTLLTFAANRALGPVITGTLGNLAPVFAVGIAAILLHEPLQARQIAGLLTIVAGIVMLSATRREDGVRWRTWLVVLPLAAAALRGLAQPAVKLGLEIWPDPFAAALASYIVSSLVVIAAATLRRQAPGQGTPRRFYLWFVVVGLCNGLAVLLMYAALARGPVSLVSPLVATYPLITVAASAIILRKTDRSPRLAFAVALTVAGVALLLAG